MAEDYVTRIEFNGLGERVSNLDKAHTATQVKTERNAEDIQDIWEGINRLTEAGIKNTEETGKKINGMIWKIAGCCLLLIVGIIVKELIK